jgi:hypothetical protein
MPPILFLKTGFMARYQGMTGDYLFSTMKYVKDNEYGHERDNFKPKRGKCYGYAPLNGIDIEKHLGAEPGALYVDGVTVVWASNRPQPEGGLVIVGWYKNARVYRHHRPKPSLIIAEAKAENCTLLPVSQRQYELPLEGVGSFRSARNWYANGFPQIIRDVNKMVAGTYKPRRGKLIAAKKPDPDIVHRAKVEQVAIDTVVKEYLRLGFDIEYVEQLNRGWDLEAALDGTLYKIEVKGTAHAQISPLLTPNEYRAAEKEKGVYHLCIVSEALSRPRLCDLRYRSELGAWTDESGVQEWDIDPVISGQAKKRK